jgi:hypothetical protein
MKPILKCALIFALFSPGLALASDAKRTAVVTAPVINMYSAPKKAADVVSQAWIGTNVTAVKKKHKWVQVRTPDDYMGWVLSNDLRFEHGPLYAEGPSVQVTSLFANVYEDRDVTTRAPIVTVPFESRLEMIANSDGQNQRWLRVRLPDEREGWIQRGDITLDPKTLTIPESIDLAKHFLGIPYLWGGRSSFGYDCSGFTQMLVRSRGITMPRDADQQAAWTGVVPVNRAELQAGDLLFFGQSPQHITHTGMYIGNGQFIHDTTNQHPVVQISTLDDQPWTTLLVAARRIK